MRELKIEQAENGYVVNMMDFTGKKRVFKSFRLLVTFMRIYFEGKTEASVKEANPTWHKEKPK